MIVGAVTVAQPPRLKKRRKEAVEGSVALVVVVVQVVVEIGIADDRGMAVAYCYLLYLYQRLGQERKIGSRLYHSITITWVWKRVEASSRGAQR